MCTQELVEQLNIIMYCQCRTPTLLNLTQLPNIPVVSAEVVGLYDVVISSVGFAVVATKE